jgi:hypothetical protein
MVAVIVVGDDVVELQPEGVDDSPWSWHFVVVIVIVVVVVVVVVVPEMAGSPTVQLMLSCAQSKSSRRSSVVVAKVPFAAAASPFQFVWTGRDWNNARDTAIAARMATANNIVVLLAGLERGWSFLSAGGFSEAASAGGWETKQNAGLRIL